MAETVLPDWLPPNSPPTLFLLTRRITMQIKATIVKTHTLNPRDPAGTKYLSVSYPLTSLLVPLSYIAPITHGSPSPRKTFTELDPVTLPTAESAYFSY